MTTPDFNFLSTSIPSYRRVQFSDFFIVANFRHFCEKYFEKEHSITNSVFLKFFLLNKTSSFILYRRGDIVQSLTHMWTYLQMCTSLGNCTELWTKTLQSNLCNRMCHPNENLYRSRFCKQLCSCAGSSTRFGKQKLERTAGKIWYSNSVRPCTENVHSHTA